VDSRDERDDRIRRLLRRGVAKAEIARRLKISRDTVDRVGAKAGFPAVRRHGKSYDWPRVRAFYEAGHSAAASQAEFGISPSSWKAAIARGDITPRPQPQQRAAGTTRAAVAELLDEGLSISQIGEQLGISKPTVCYHARRLGVPARGEFARRYDWSEIRMAYESGLSMRECKRRFGFSSNAWADAVQRGDIVPRLRRIPIETLLVVGRRTSRTHLKERLLSEGLKEGRCERCGIADWDGEALSMQLHHTNGVGNDNRLENLQLLCANCHSLTANYGGRNGHRRKAA
jgi:DNA-binding CsgD family transcriptional regulator/5-methylcytosine-specific restriction endonuclease McrA